MLTVQKWSTYRIKVQMMKVATNWSYKEKNWTLVVKKLLESFRLM